MDPSILNHLLDEANRQRLTLFIGADLPQAVTGIPGSSLQAQSIRDRFDVQGTTPHDGLSDSVQAAGRLRYQPIIQHLRDMLESGHLDPQPFDLMVARLPVSTFFTTRLDGLLLRGFDAIERPVQRVVTDFDAGFVTGDRATLVKIYGDLSQPASLTLSQDDLYDLPQRKRQITLLLERAMSSSTLLFLGADLNSPDFLALWRSVLRSLGRFAPMAYAAIPESLPASRQGTPSANPLSDEQKRLWAERNITLLDDSALKVVQTLHGHLEPVGKEPAKTIMRQSGSLPSEPPVQGYQNFDLEVSRQANGPIQSRILRSPAGEAQAESPPIDALSDLFSAILSDIPDDTLDDTHTDAPRDTPRGAALTLSDLATFSQQGQALGQILFPGPIAARWSASQIIAEQAKEGLRLRLFFPKNSSSQDDGAGRSGLDAIPWELAQLGDQRLALRPQSPMVRYVNAPRPGDALDVSGPLRLLVFTSHVESENLPDLNADLNLDGELALMEEALAPLVANGSVQVHWPQTHQLTRRGMMDQLRQVRPHLLHYIGHGLYDDAEQAGYLLISASNLSQPDSFQPDSFQPELLSMNELSLMLDGSNVQFGFFNACASGAAAGGIAQNVVQATLPAALGMQVDVPDEASSLFAGAFYRALADRWPVDAAVVEGRRLLAGEFGLDSGWWGLPVLYMRLADGRLF